MANFLGRYDHQMDEKGRVSLPSAFRKEAGGEAFVLLQWREDHLSLFAQEDWQEKRARLIEVRKANPKAWNTVRQIVAGAVEVSPDKQGRILIPSWLQEAAGLGGSVVLIGNLDQVELWNPDSYGQASQGARSEDYEDTAESIFG